MPKLDGMAATSLIRKFDPRTPIISMTSNSEPNEIMSYFSSGMNDILPKPFTQAGLLGMLEVRSLSPQSYIFSARWLMSHRAQKHLMHLKVIQQQMSRVPRSVGIPPLSDSSFEEALIVQAAAHHDGNSSDGEVSPSNPLAGMGLTDEYYCLIMQSLLNGENTFGAGAGGEGLGLGGLLNGTGAGPSTGLGTAGFGGGVGVGGGSGLGEKRALDESDDGRDEKRCRFEVLE
jgi:osomolarity two-component system, response regulator SKN7